MTPSRVLGRGVQGRRVAGAAKPARSAPGQPNRPLRRDMPLVPSDSIAGRALVTLIAIMTFLAALSAGVAILIAAASRDWQQDVSHEMTIQVRPLSGADVDAAVAKVSAAARRVAGVAAVDPYSKAESEKLLQPWLGSDLDLGNLPIPRLVVVKLARGGTLDVASLRREVDAVPGASLDDHGLWISRLASMARATVAIGLGVFALVLVAMLLAVTFATRGAMAGNKEIIEILHFVGAADSFISRQFQLHFLRLGLRGGAIGGGIAIVFFFVAGRVFALWRTSAGGEQIEALFGGFGLGLFGYLAIVVIAVAVALLTGVVSRLIVYRHLRAMM